MMTKNNTKPVRIGKELEEELIYISKKNNINIRQASQEAAKELRKLKGKKIQREIIF